jgi:hypothetical protein
MAAAPVTGTLTTAYTTAATGIGLSFTPVIAIGPATTGTPVSFNITLDQGSLASTPFTGTVLIQRSTNGGTNWGSLNVVGAAYSATTPTPSGIVFTASTAGATGGYSITLTETQSGCLYRIFVLAYTQGTLTYVFSQ